MTLSELKNWLSQPDDRDILPVRGVVMRLAAEEIGRLEQEVARLRQEARNAASTAEPPAQITFRDGARERTLIRSGDGYALPDDAETLDDVRAAALAEGAAAAASAPETPDESAEGADAPDGADAADGEDTAAVNAGAEDAPAAADAGDASGDPAGDDGDEEDFELPPEWQ